VTHRTAKDYILELERQLGALRGVMTRERAFAEAFRRVWAEHDVFFKAWSSGASEPRRARAVRYSAWTAARAGRRLREVAAGLTGGRQ